MNEFRADLHCHSSFSDGSLTPEELIGRAKTVGLQGLSITDHDTIDAYKISFDLAKSQGIELIPGVEFSAMLDGVSVHILGYSFDLNSDALLHLCQRHVLRRQNRNRAILEKLQARNMLIMEEELGSSHTVGRPHIAIAMVKKGYVANIQEAFKLYIGEKASCYASGTPISVEETIETLHQAKGLAVIAHPHLIQETKTLNKLLEINFDGIECYYGTFHHNQYKRWIKIAENKNWLMTGGSDFHGSIKPHIPLGCSFVRDQTFTILKNHYQAHSELF